MRRTFTVITFLTVSFCALSQKLNPADEESKVSFKIKNLGFNVGGSFKGLSGDIVFDPDDLAGSSFDVSVDATTINTGINLRDNHLKGGDYFDVEHYPKIRFNSTRVTPSNKAGIYFVHGRLTIKRKTQDVIFPFTAVPENGGYRFKGEFKIKRLDFDVGGHSTLSNEVTVELDVFGKN